MWWDCYKAFNQFKCFCLHEVYKPVIVLICFFMLIEILLFSSSGLDMYHIFFPTSLICVQIIFNLDCLNMFIFVFSLNSKCCCYWFPFCFVLLIWLVLRKCCYLYMSLNCLNYNLRLLLVLKTIQNKKPFAVKYLFCLVLYLKLLLTMTKLGPKGCFPSPPLSSFHLPLFTSLSPPFSNSFFSP